MKNVNFHRLAAKNFLSIGEEPVEISFTKGLHVITGSNKDKPDRRNAIGKSTIADALYFAIFGVTLRDIKKDLITNNITGGNTHVELDVEVDSVKGKDEFKIIRTLNPSRVQVYKNGRDKTRDSISNTTKYICDVLSASPAIFQNCVIMTVNNAIPFMAKNKIDKRKFIEDIFGMEIFSQMLSQLRAEYNDIKREYEAEVAKFEEIETSLKNYNRQKEVTLNRRKEKKKTYLTRQQNNTVEIEDLDSQLNSLEGVSVNEIETNGDTLQNQITTCDDKISEYISIISEEKAKIKHKKEQALKIGTEEDTCPVCLRPIEEHDLDNIKKEKQQLESSIDEMIENVKSIHASLVKVKDVKGIIQKSISKNTAKLTEAKLIKQKKVNIEERIKQLNSWQSELKVDLAAVEDLQTDFDDLINETEERINTANNNIDSFRKQISKLDIVKYIVSEEGVKSYIVNKLLDLLNSKLMHYLRRLDSNSICVFNEYFEEEILNEKNKVCSYFNFSGAERKSIDLACLFTFSDIRRMQGGVKYNIAIYDELFDSSFDEKGIELITEILQDRVEELDECSIVISHRKESVKAVTGDVIYLQKQNGITRRVDYIEL
jgi:DNA repair exonuclease SbcCD ATPase subunit